VASWRFRSPTTFCGISSAAARIDAFCTAHGLASGISFDVTLAVDELVTNTIGYG